MNTLKENQLLYRLGVDLGTSSIGTAVYKIDGEGKILSLEHLDSYIFGEPVAPKEMLTLNTARRTARLIRRQVERKAARLRKIGHIAKSLGVERGDSAADTQDVIELRARAVSEKISLPQLIKVFCHIVKNRGYKGVVSEKVVGKKLKETEKLLQDGKTLGQLLWEEKQKAAKGQPWRKIEEDGTFVYRHMVEEEFERIWQEQAKQEPRLNGMYAVWGDNMFPDYPNQKEISLHDAFHSAMFYQRPIKWELDTVGDCPLFPEEKRASCAQIAYQRYRLAKEISNLRLIDRNKKKTEPLPLETQERIFNYIETNTALYSKTDGVFPFDKIYEFLQVPETSFFTVHRGSKKGLKGNTTQFGFESIGILNEWSILTDKEQELVIEFLSNVTNMSDIEDNESSYIQERFLELTENITASDCEKSAGARFVLAHKNKFSGLQLEKNRSSYSVKGLDLLLSEIQQGHFAASNEEEYVEALAVKNKTYTGKLRTVKQILDQEAINDPVISRALTEFHRVMTYIIHKYGNPQEVVVELSRDMKNSLRRRQFLEGQNRLQAAERKKAKEELMKCGVFISSRNIEKYLLWEEQGHKCPYSGQPIDFAAAFDEKKTQVDHIIPQQGDVAGPNVFENKVLVFTDQNKEKSNCLPYDWRPDFRADIDAYLAFMKDRKAKKKKGEEAETSYRASTSLVEFVQRLWGLYNKEKKGYYSARERKYKPTQKGARILRKINNLLTTQAELKEDFSNRQNQETAWISKIVLDWCKDVCPKVTPSFGALTAYLRSHLHFDRVLPLIRISEKKPLYDKDDREIDSKKWEELFAEKGLYFSEAEALKGDFEKFCETLEQAPATDSDKQQAFKDFCAAQRSQFQFNKRCDHRHHAVDAAVIGLCNLSLVQRAEKHHRNNGTLHKIEFLDKNNTHIPEKDIPGFMVENIPQCARLREEVQKRLTNYVVWHKPDHYPSGKFFDETAYNVVKKNGTERFVKRAELSSFLKANEKKTLENLEKLLFADTIKEAIITQFKERLAKGMSQEEALCGRKEDSQDGIYYRGNKVKKVKYMYLVGSGVREFNPNADKKITIQDKNGKEYRKGYQNYGYACMDFDAKTGKRVALIPLWQYQQKKQIPEGVVRVFAGDVLMEKTTKQFYKVQKFNARQGIYLRNTTEVQENDISTSNLKNYSVVSARQDIAKVKSE